MYATQSWHSQFYREPFPIRSNSSPQKALGHLYQDLMHYAPLHIMFYKWGIWAIFPFPRDNQPEVTILLGLYSANNAHSHTCCCQKNISSAAKKNVTRGCISTFSWDPKHNRMLAS